ncbi:MAG: MBG domain-containing protein [Candidatus Faecousia sp.]|nr:MBG domain-containing protein [Candidatus Faecousia sp.]
MKKRTNTNPMRRLLSLALSIVMVLSLLPAGALAEEPVLDEPVQEELVQEQPVQEEPAQEEPVQEEPEKEEPVQEEPVEQEPEQKQESEQEPVVKTESAEEEAQSASTDAVITDWEWDDGYEIVDVESGYVILPFTSEEFASSLDDVKGMLPEAILVGEEALTLGNWTYETGEEGAVVTIDSESCPSPGIFKITLPEGYVLADGTNVLSLTVALSAGSSEGTSSYADSDTLTNVPYYDADGTRKTCPLATKVVENKVKDGPNTTWTTGWYVVEGTVEIGGEIHTDPNDLTKTEILYKSVSVQGDVNLILKEGSELQMLHGHIDVPEGSSLTVYCDNTSNSGTLKVWGAINHAAIGGSPDSPDSGKITINGGTVTAHTGNGGAGIGSGEGGSAGDITINGGDIEATANNGGAAIGTGKKGKSAIITIKNCQQIYARSSGGAGIGSGENSSGDGKVTVNIHGGKIDAHGRDGAGIGSGKNAPLSVDVNITGGNIYAQTSGMSAPESHGAAIGGGYGATNTTVKIGGTAEVDAHGGENAPGIGSINPDGCSVTISGGTVRASGGTFGAGIGGAHEQASCPVTITGGTVTATGGATGAGIGSGCGTNSTTRFATGRIEISGGTVTANGGYFAAGIGGGEYNTAGDILISGGTVIATRDTSKDNDSTIQGGRFDIGDGFIFINNTPVYARYTLNGSAKLYLQNGFSNPGIRDEIKPSINSGYIFNGTPDTYKEIRVYGSQTLSENFCIDTGKTMTVMSNASLNTGNYGIYVQNGGTLKRDGMVNGNVYYPLTLTACTATNTTPYQSSLFGKEGARISLTPALQSGYKLDKWTVTPDTVTVSNNSFRMPQQATTVKANVVQAVNITTQPADQEIIYGNNVTLSVGAQNPSGTTDGIFYQWYKGAEELTGETGSTLTLTKPDAGTYSYFCRVTWDGVSVDSSKATVKVNQATGSANITGTLDKSYDGQPAALAESGYSVTGDGTVTVEYTKRGKNSYSPIAPTDAGSYTVRVTMSENQNYKGASATKDFTISKATDNAWQTEPSVTNFTYGDTETNPVTYQAKYGNDEVQVTYKKQGTEGTSSTTVPTEAGTYDVTVSLAETASYPGLPDVSLTLTIAKAASSVTTPPKDAQSRYTAGNVPLVTEETPAGGTMHYSLDGETWSAEIPTATDCGKYTVYYKVVGDNNHTDTEEQTLTAEIVPFKVPETQNTVTIDYGQDAALSVNPNTNLPNEITYQWYQGTGEGDVELTGATENELTIIKPIADTYTFVCKVTCGDYFKYSTVPVEVKPVALTNVDLSGYWAEGGEREIAQGETVTLTNPSSRLLTKYTTTTNDQGGEYPTGMAVYSIVRDDGGAKLQKIDKLDNLLQYSGCSIRINGKPGIRMITSLTKEAKELLKKGELAGYTLEEYGTVVAWDNGSGDQPLTLSTGKSNYAYRKGVSDPVFANVGNLTQYTNVLVWDSLPDEKYAMDIAMRPYIILSKDGETVTLYGGTVSRSIGYVAQQNADTFPKGSAGYKYVHDIIDRVNKLTNNSQQS